MASKHRTPTMTEPRKGNQVDRIIAERTLTARHEAAQAKHKAEQAAAPALAGPTTPAKAGAAPQRRRKGPGAGL